MTREEELLAANNLLVENRRKAAAQLRKNREQFAFYAKEHRAKIGVKFEEGTPGAIDTIKKAEANEAMVAEIDQVLAEISPR